MTTGMTGRTALALGASLLLSACGGRDSAVEPGSGTGPKQARDEVPPDQLSAVMVAHYRGLGAMERYEYGAAAEAFREVERLAPGWTPGRINLAIALFNQGGVVKEQAKTGAGPGDDAAAETNIDEAVRIFDAVIAAQPDNPHAHFCRGIILKDRGNLADAHADFRKVAEVDPGDPNAWLELGSTLVDPETGINAGRAQASELIDFYTKALARNPYLITANYKLNTAYRLAGKPDLAKEQYAAFAARDPNQQPSATGEAAKLVYGEMGKYGSIIDPFPRAKQPKAVAPRPQFDAARSLGVQLAPGHRWASSADFSGPLAVVGRARARFGAGVAAFDADGDGDLDLYLTAAVVGPKGLHDAFLLNEGEGRFRDVTRAFGLPDDRAGLGVAVGDFDADRRLDLFLTGAGDNRLYRNVGGRFEDLTARLGEPGPKAISPTARWLDIDQDGDLDLYVLNYAVAAGADRAFTGKDEPAGLPNVAYRNDGMPSPIGTSPEKNWVPIGAAPPETPAVEGLSIAFSTKFPAQELLWGGKGRHTSVAALDVDGDRDIDLALGSDDQPIRVLLNDRAGAFTEAPPGDLSTINAVSGLLVADLDKDARPDLVALGAPRPATAWRNASTRSGATTTVAWTPFPVDARGWRGATVFDVDLDTWPDLLALPASGTTGPPAWARNAGTRLEFENLPIPPDGPEAAPLAGLALANLVGDLLPDVVTFRDGEGPKVARNLGNGNHWLALDLGGRWKTGFDQMRTNPQALGTRFSLEGQGIFVPYDLTTTTAGPAQSVTPVVLGLGEQTSAPLLRIRWPDGVMQCELNITGDKALALAEQSRKTGSCPVLFTWNGSKFECVGDFLGTSGLGFLLEPGVHHQPDRDEALAITSDQLKAVDGVYRLSVTEPMDEIAYLDKLTLDVVDRPPGSSVGLDERFSTDGRKPSGAVFAWTHSVEPARATDHDGRDVTPLIRRWDRQTVDRFAKLRGWVGYTEPHALVLDFEHRLAGFGPARKLMLCLAGWVEYPYSQTNYAAATAGVASHPPVLERRREDGTWEVIDANPGFPAGLPRMMALDLTGKLGGGRCVLRLTTNMECYWDQAFVAVVDEGLPLRTTSLPVLRAALGDRGYLREGSPDGRMPLLYEYDHVDPAPLARMEGLLTRYGDVAALLTEDDDKLCTVGSGDEARVEFDARSLPLLPDGWTRSFVLRTYGYCKEADPFTATSDSVGPLPWKGMGHFPFGPEGERPIDPAYSRYLREYQTRPAGLR